MRVRDFNGEYGHVPEWVTARCHIVKQPIRGGLTRLHQDYVAWYHDNQFPLKRYGLPSFLNVLGLLRHYQAATHGYNPKRHYLVLKPVYT